MFKQAGSLTRVFRHQLKISPSPSSLIHTLPTLANQSQYEAQGIPGFLSPNAFKQGWTDYQNYLLENLTQLTMDSENESRVPFHIVLNTSAKPDHAHVFNYASQAHNNHMFFQALRSVSENTTKPSAPLLERINKSFGSMESLRAQMLTDADTLLGNGWVFLVEGEDKMLYTMATFNAGTPYDLSRSQMFDLNSAVGQDTWNTLSQIEKAVYGKEKNHSIVLLALNVWEHIYVPDYSVSGRADYLEKWWDSIDWDVVSSRLFVR
jgi:Fe-Mn family superoxide dismutase